MTKFSLADILELDVSERIQLVEDIWDSIAAAPDSVTLTDAQRVELERRLASHRQSPETASPWEEVKQRISKPR